MSRELLYPLLAVLGTLAAILLLAYGPDRPAFHTPDRVQVAGGEVVAADTPGARVWNGRAWVPVRLPEDAAPVSSGPQIKDERGTFPVSTWQVEIPAQPLKLHCKPLKTDVNGVDLECIIQP